eukprot:1721084-Alexandrium_andersonii.AAC.1
MSEAVELRRVTPASAPSAWCTGPKARTESRSLSRSGGASRGAGLEARRGMPSGGGPATA